MVLNLDRDHINANIINPITIIRCLATTTGVVIPAMVVTNHLIHVVTTRVEVSIRMPVGVLVVLSDTRQPILHSLIALSCRTRVTSV